MPFREAQSQFISRSAEDLTETIPGSTIKCTGKPRIERIKTKEELMEKLNRDLTDKKLSPSCKSNKIRTLVGFCSVCGALPTHIMIYDCGGAQVLERYCSPCLEKEQERQKSNYYSIEY